jgi:predicted MFS family arabinose efflux permease
MTIERFAWLFVVYAFAVVLARYLVAFLQNKINNKKLLLLLEVVTGFILISICLVILTLLK